MPIYEYKCASCAFQQEYLQKLSEPQMTVCPSCGKETFKKMLSAAGFQLKGSGWYATDFKNSGQKPATANKTEAGSEAKAEAKSDSTSDAKSDAKTESKSASKTEAKTETKSDAKPASSSKPEATPA